MRESYFDGGLFQYIGHVLLGSIVTVLSFGLLFPWAYTNMIDWKVKHTVIDGRRLRFDGSAMGLFGQWIKWFLLILITFGIYGFWVNIALKKWITKNTHFES